MTYHYEVRDGFDEAFAQSNGILGEHFKFAKGKAFISGEEVETGDKGIKFCVLMDSAMAGKVLWQDQRIVERDIGRVADGFRPPREKMQENWCPYISFQCVGLLARSTA